MKPKNLHTIIWKENKLFVARFLELELASQGKTQAEALKNLKEALDLYLEDENIKDLSIPYIQQVTTKLMPLN